jgi:hypothetical protein
MPVPQGPPDVTAPPSRSTLCVDHQRQGCALHPDFPAGIGLCPAVAGSRLNNLHSMGRRHGGATRPPTMAPKPPTMAPKPPDVRLSPIPVVVRLGSEGQRFSQLRTCRDALACQSARPFPPLVFGCPMARSQRISSSNRATPPSATSRLLRKSRGDAWSGRFAGMRHQMRSWADAGRGSAVGRSVQLR